MIKDRTFVHELAENLYSLFDVTLYATPLIICRPTQRIDNCLLTCRDIQLLDCDTRRCHDTATRKWRGVVTTRSLRVPPPDCILPSFNLELRVREARVSDTRHLEDDNIRNPCWPHGVAIHFSASFNRECRACNGAISIDVTIWIILAARGSVSSFTCKLHRRVAKDFSQAT